MEISKEVSIKDLLKKGTTEKELQDILAEQIKEAKAEIASEKKSIRTVDKRAAAVEAFAEYINSLGTGEIMFADDVEKIINWIDKNEDLVKGMVDVYLRKNRKDHISKTTCGCDRATKDSTLDYVDKILETYKKLFE